MTYSSVYGDLLGPDAIEEQILTFLQAPPVSGSTAPLLVYYLAEVERQRGLAARTLPVPPGPDSYRGGIDFNVVMTKWCPQVTVAIRPAAEPERQYAGVYEQWYEVKLAATVTDEDEDSARILADRYGVALMGLVQSGGFGTRVDMTGATVPFFSKTVLVGSPEREFPNAEMRRLVRSVVTCHSLLEGIVDETQGPRGPVPFPTDPYSTPGVWPTVTSIDIQLQSKNSLGAVGPASGVSVTDSSGHVIISE